MFLPKDYWIFRLINYNPMMRLLLIIWLSLPIALVGQIQQAENLTLLGAQRLLNFSYEEAIKALDKAIQLDPNNWVAYEFRAQAHYRLDDKALALQDLDRAIRLNATNPELYFRRGILHEIFELQEDAKSDYRSAIRLNGGTYNQAEERLSYLSDAFPSSKDENGRIAQGGVLSYAPNHFSSKPYRYDTDRIQIQRREYMKEEPAAPVEVFAFLHRRSNRYSLFFYSFSKRCREESYSLSLGKL